QPTSTSSKTLGKPRANGDLSKDHLIAGGVAGAVSRTVVSPLERMKILFQVQGPQMSAYQGVFPTLLKMWREEGFLGFLRGNGTNVIRIIPYSATQFAAYEKYKRLLLEEGKEELDAKRRLTAGALAGITSVSCTYPLDIVRTRLSVQSASLGCVGSQNKLPGIWMTMKIIYKTEGGIRALYRGLSPTLMGVAPYVALNFHSYEVLRKYFTPENKTSPPVAQKLLCGALAGTFAQTMTYPLDVLRRRMQVTGMGLVGYNYRNTWDAVTQRLPLVSALLLTKHARKEWVYHNKSRASLSWENDDNFLMDFNLNRLWTVLWIEPFNECIIFSRNLGSMLVVILSETIAFLDIVGEIHNFTAITFTPVSSIQNKKRISSDKSNSSAIPGQVSILKDRDLRPYWNKQATEFVLFDKHELLQDTLPINTSYLLSTRASEQAKSARVKRQQLIANFGDGRYSQLYTINQGVLEPSSKATLEAVQEKTLMNTKTRNAKKLQYGTSESLLRGIKDKASAIINEAVDEVLIAKEDLTTVLDNHKALYPLHSKKRGIIIDGSFSQDNEVCLRIQDSKHLRETQADDSVHVVSINPGVCMRFKWYSIGRHPMKYIVRICKYLDDPISQKGKLLASSSKRKVKMTQRLVKAIFRMRRKVIRRQNESYRKSAKFFTSEFDAIVIPSFGVSDMLNRKTRKTTRKIVQKMLCCVLSLSTTSDHQGRGIRVPCYYPERSLHIQEF
ncbi:hypothetical protein G9A89_020096, partial [Geosiphon pyriformis]